MTIDDPERRSDPFVESFYCFMAAIENREEVKGMEKLSGKQETKKQVRSKMGIRRLHAATVNLQKISKRKAVDIFKGRKYESDKDTLTSRKTSRNEESGYWLERLKRDEKRLLRSQNWENADRMSRKKDTGRHSVFSRKISWSLSAIYDQRRFSIKNRKEVCPVTRADSLYNEIKSWQRQIAVSLSWMANLVDFKTKIGMSTLLNSKFSKDFVRMSLFFFQIGWKLLIPSWNSIPHDFRGVNKGNLSFKQKESFYFRPGRQEEWCI